MARRTLGWQCSTAFGAVIAHAALAWGSGVAAAADLSVEEPSLCTTRDELAFRVERLLGQALSDAENLQLSVRVHSTVAGFVAQLDVARPQAGAERGMRSLRAASCDALSEALALAIVVAISAEAEAPTSAPAPTAAPAGDVPTAAAEPFVSADQQVSAPGPLLSGSAWLIGDSGTLPVLGLGLALGVGLVWSGAEVRLLGTWLAEREGMLVATDPSSPGASISLMAGGVQGCVPVGVDRAVVEVAACLGGEIGQLWGSGTHVSVPHEQHRLWTAARVDVEARWPVPRTPLGLELSVGGVVPFTRDEFILKDLGTVHRPASVVGRLGVGVSVAID